jgi:lysophospholipase L1-like esterase
MGGLRLSDAVRGVVIAATVAACHATVVDQSKEARFLALGDSYTIGESVAEGERWPNQLAALLRAEGMAVGDPQIIARTGWTTDELSKAIDDAGPKGPFQLVTLLIGVNNQYRGRDAAEYRRHFSELLDRAIAFAGGDPKKVIVVSIPDWGVTPFAKDRQPEKIAGEIDRFNAINREETARAKARYVDVTTVSRLRAGLIAGDGLHPSGEMYTEWAKLVLPHARAVFGR